MPLQGTLQISKTASLFPSQRWSNAQRDRRLLVPFGFASSVPRRRWITIVWCSSSVLRRRWTPLMGCPDGLSSLAAQITITLCVLDGFTIIGSAYHHPYVCCYLRCHSSSLSLATDALSSRCWTRFRAIWRRSTSSSRPALARPKTQRPRLGKRTSRPDQTTSRPYTPGGADCNTQHPAQPKSSNVVFFS